MTSRRPDINQPGHHGSELRMPQALEPGRPRRPDLWPPPRLTVIEGPRVVTSGWDVWHVDGHHKGQFRFCSSRCRAPPNIRCSGSVDVYSTNLHAHTPRESGFHVGLDLGYMVIDPGHAASAAWVRSAFWIQKKGMGIECNGILANGMFRGLSDIHFLLALR